MADHERFCANLSSARSAELSSTCKATSATRCSKNERSGVKRISEHSAQFVKGGVGRPQKCKSPATRAAQERNAARESRIEPYDPTWRTANSHRAESTVVDSFPKL